MKEDDAASAQQPYIHCVDSFAAALHTYLNDHIKVRPKHRPGMLDVDLQL